MFYTMGLVTSNIHSERQEEQTLKPHLAAAALNPASLVISQGSHLQVLTTN